MPTQPKNRHKRCNTALAETGDRPARNRVQSVGNECTAWSLPGGCDVLVAQTSAHCSSLVKPGKLFLCKSMHQTALCQRRGFNAEAVYNGCRNGLYASSKAITLFEMQNYRALIGVAHAKPTTTAELQAMQCDTNLPTILPVANDSARRLPHSLRKRIEAGPTHSSEDESKPS